MTGTTSLDYGLKLPENLIKWESTSTLPEVQDIQQKIASTLTENPKNKEKSEIPPELKDYREAWKEMIKFIDDEVKERIIKATEKIKPNVIPQEDGSRLIEFNLGGKKWKILDSKLNKHINQSDDFVSYFEANSITNIKKDHVTLRGMQGDNVDDWKNEKLANYVKEKEKEGLHIPSENEMRKLLAELGKQINSDELSDQIAMLMYLTGMDGPYWLSMRDSGLRSVLECDALDRAFGNDYGNASLCMIGCEQSDA